MQPFVQTVQTSNPNGVALVAMGRAALDAAKTWTMREWASRLAALAGPRDYVGQLRELYRGIVDRWRYVQEHGEWVPGTGRALLAHTLGANYNRGPSCPSAEQCDVEGTPWRNLGFGDCDDVASLSAAGVLSVGGTPFFRVARGRFGAHVSVTAKTPAGDLVEIDPVGHPDHGFGWAVDGPDVQIEHYDMQGRPVALLGGGAMPYEMPMTAPMMMADMGGYLGAPELDLPGTYMGGVLGVESQLPKTHMALVHPNDQGGPRVIAIPEWHARVFKRGASWDGTPGVDQYGQSWTYDADTDVWMPSEVWNARASSLGYLGAWDFGRRRRLRIGKRIRKVFRRIVRGVRRVASRILRSKLVQAVLSRLLNLIGVPAAASRGVMEAAGQILKEGGIIGLIRLARKSPKAAMRKLAQAIAKAGKAALIPPVARGLLKGYTDDATGVGTNVLYQVETPMGTYHAAPVAMLAGCPGVYEFGQLEVSDTPQPGRWYRVKKGDSLLGIAGKAFGLGSGGERLKRAQWIDGAAANAYALGPSSSDFDKKYFGPEIVKLLPRHACETDAAIAGEAGSCYPVLWIPPAKGVEPPEEPEPVPPEPMPDVDEEEAETEEAAEEPAPPPTPPPCPPGGVWDPQQGRCVAFAPVPPEPEPDVEEMEEEEVAPAPPVEEEAAPEEPEPPEPTPPIEEEEIRPPACPPGYRHPTPGEQQVTGMRADSCIPIDFRVPQSMCPAGYIWSQTEDRCKYIAPGPEPTPPGPTPPAPAPTPPPIVDVFPEDTTLPPAPTPAPMPPQPAGGEELPWPLILLALGGGM